MFSVLIMKILQFLYFVAKLNKFFTTSLALPSPWTLISPNATNLIVQSLNLDRSERCGDLDCNET